MLKMLYKHISVVFKNVVQVVQEKNVVSFRTKLVETKNGKNFQQSIQFKYYNILNAHAILTSYIRIIFSIK